MTEIQNPPGYKRIGKNEYIIEQPQPEQQQQQKEKGPLRGKGTSHRGPLIMQNIPVKHSERRPLSLEEAQKERPGGDDFLYGVPGARVVKTRTQLFDNMGGGWYDT